MARHIYIHRKTHDQSEVDRLRNVIATLRRAGFEADAREREKELEKLLKMKPLQK